LIDLLTLEGLGLTCYAGVMQEEAVRVLKEFYEQENMNGMQRDGGFGLLLYDFVIIYYVSFHFNFDLGPISHFSFFST
jgi:hypothetical protein